LLMVMGLRNWNELFHQLPLFAGVEAAIAHGKVVTDAETINSRSAAARTALFLWVKLFASNKASGSRF